MVEEAEARVIKVAVELVGAVVLVEAGEVAVCSMALEELPVSVGATVQRRTSIFPVVAGAVAELAGPYS